MSSEQIKERDGWKCARCGRGSDLDVHHRLARSGGTDESFANLVSLCRGCHRWLHHHPVQARAEGWIVRAQDDPAAVPVKHWMWPAGPILLLADGSIQIFQTE